MDLKKVTLAGSLLSVGCAVAAQGVEFRTTTFAEPWHDASASVESAKASGADLSLDIAATDQTVLGFGVCASELSWNSLSARRLKTAEGDWLALVLPPSGAPR